MQLSSIVSSIGSNNPIILGAVSVWILGVSSFFLRKVPIKFYNSIKAYFVVTVTVNNINDSSTAIAHSILDWYMTTKYSKGIRNFFLEPSFEDRMKAKGSSRVSFPGDVLLGPGYSSNYFIFNGRLGWIKRTSGKNSETTTAASEMTISFLSSDSSIITDFVESVKPIKSDNEIAIYSCNNSLNKWKIFNERKKRDINSVIINRKVKQEIIDNITNFYNDKDWHISKGLIHKLTYLLHGQPGTGKSSIIFALACYFNAPIYMVNVNTISDKDFTSIMAQIPPGAFVVFEDLELSSTVVQRESVTDQTSMPLLGSTVSNDRLSMSNLLNTLDGISSIDDNVIFITSNYIENIDSAIKRKGRIDHTVEIPLMKEAEIKEYVEMMYPGRVKEIEHIEFKEIAGCDIQALFLEHRNDFDNFAKHLIRDYALALFHNHSTTP